MPVSSQPATPATEIPPTCAKCQAILASDATICMACGAVLPLAYTGPTMRLQSDPYQTYLSRQLNATGSLTGRIDAAALALILDELRTNGDRDAAIRQVAQLYNCHWDAAEVLVGRIERRYKPSQQAPWLWILSLLFGLVLLACFAWVALMLI